MRLYTSFLAGSAAITLLTHCASTRPSSPGEPPAPPEVPVPAPSNTPWGQARVGDHAVYSFSTNQSPGRIARPPRALAGRLRVEVTAVQAPWVWLTLSFTDDAGKPLTNVWLARDLTLPVSMETSRPLDVPPRGTESFEQLSAAGRQWEAKRYIEDQRPVDGPLNNVLYAVQPGPLYLTRGLLSLSITLSGFGASGGTQLTLLEVRQGPEGGASPASPLERPLGPGTWFDFRANIGGNDSTQRTCFSAERGYLLQAEGPAPTQGAACPSFAEATVSPLEEWLVRLITGALATESWPPVTAGAPPSRGTLPLQGRTVPVSTTEVPENEGSVRKIRFETYAADPWDASLAGLAHEARFRPLTEGVDRVEAKGRRTPQDFTQLVGWGTWVGSAK
ncbi:DUF6068 family protein [Stigmatella aurantiaca]|uniref:Conserved uncharacterized protein n=1 Tax=Stigmatella aurantiaca (strain DW4/3-1) TaxID=378806 RepID=Q08XP5_STIAD|nr:DUF6068 family protein [Stigmatella aurantiaca]ADO75378.1 conserved uncharacterized protein [Stigmatella aurantiaca DW4/3-1]EAU65258.1 hypothetical protein STIAU_5741 [Stigmatella aurantiaca DW4/3-1]